jgi:hypothetical protein
MVGRSLITFFSSSHLFKKKKKKKRKEKEKEKVGHEN